MRNNKYPNLLCFLENKTKGMESNVALSMNTIVGWKELTFGGIGILSRHLASYLMEKGIQKRDRMSIIS